MPYDVLINERVKQFHIEHGEVCLAVGNDWVYADGARRDQNPMGYICDPPKDPHELAALQVKFHKAAVKLAVEKFDRLKAELAMWARAAETEGSAAPSQEKLDELKALQKQVLKAQRKLRLAEAKFTETIPREIIEHRKILASNRQKGSEFMSALSDIKV